MKIHGLMKMTLLDFPGLVACTVFFGGCDMRCPFCHNWELVDINAPAVMDDEELLKFLSKRQGLLDGVVFTGGEPLLRKDIDIIMRKIKDMGFKLKLDTNGNHPDELIRVVGEGLVDYVAMDVKNSLERYGETIGIPGFDTTNILKSIEFLLKENVPYEFRTTVVKTYHDEDSFRGIAKLIEGASEYYLQGFVDRDTVPVGGLEGYGPEEMKSFLNIVKPYVKRAELRGIE